MGNFFLIYRYEILKVTKKKIVRMFFAIIFILNLLINLHSIIDYSVGSMGTDMDVPNKYGRQISYMKAFMKGDVILRYVDDKGMVIVEEVGPLEYIRRVREYAMKWSGIPLDDRTINEMRDFLDQYDYQDETGYSYGWSFQNYYWVYKSIFFTGLNPEGSNVSEDLIRSNMEENWRNVYDAEQLTEEERAFWDACPRLAFPLKMAYLPAYYNLITSAEKTHIMLLFFVIISLCGCFSSDRENGLRQITQAAPKAVHKAAIARLCAGETIIMAAGLILYLTSFMVQFTLFGTDGFHTPLQQVMGMSWSKLMITAGQGVLILCGCSLLICLSIGAVTMLLSQLSQSSVATLALTGVFLLLTLLYEYQIFYEDRQLSQLIRYLPIQRIAPDFLYDERLVSLAGRLVPAIPLTLGIYPGIMILALSLCIASSVRGRLDRK